MNRWIFNCILRFKIFCFNFAVDTNFPILSSKDKGSLEIFFSCEVVVIVGASVDEVAEARITSSFTMSFDENLFVVSFSIFLSAERHSVYDFI